MESSVNINDDNNDIEGMFVDEENSGIGRMG